MRRKRPWSIALFACFWMCGAHAAADAAAPCSQASPTTFIIDGPVDKALADCVKAQLKDSTQELIVTSGGGNLKLAIEIAERLAPLRLLVKVRGHCDSGCQLFFLPVARRIEFEPRAYSIAHGGADPALIKHDLLDRKEERIRVIRKEQPTFSQAKAKTIFDAAIESMRSQVQMQEDFRQRHKVGRGWYIYREGGDGDFGRFLHGEPGPKPSVFGYRYLLVEEPLLRSCLPDVEIAPYQSNVEANIVGDTQRWRRFQKEGTRRSGQLECAEPGGAAAGTPQS